MDYCTASYRWSFPEDVYRVTLTRRLTRIKHKVVARDVRLQRYALWERVGNDWYPVKLVDDVPVLVDGEPPLKLLD